MIFSVELLDAGSEILFKKSADRLDHKPTFSVKGLLSLLGNVLRMPAVWCGFLLFSCGLLVWSTVLAEADLSLAFPVGGIRYLLIMAAANFFLGERIGRKRLLGGFCIALGVLCIGLS